MSEERVNYTTNGNNLLQTLDKHDTIAVSRHELEQEHVHLMARLQQLRRLLGFPPLPTGSQLRRDKLAR